MKVFHVIFTQIQKSKILSQGLNYINFITQNSTSDFYENDRITRVVQTLQVMIHRKCEVHQFCLQNHAEYMFYSGPSALLA